jgi:hypothetical protein
LKIRYTGPAARQLGAIPAYIKARSPDGGVSPPSAFSSPGGRHGAIEFAADGVEKV